MLDAPAFNTPPLQTTAPRRVVGTRVGGGSVAAPVQSNRPVDDPEQNADSRRAQAQENQVLQQLRARDAEVRAHERAHLAAGGEHVRGGARFAYQKGPDGRLYAIGGEVSIDTSPVPNNPQATLAKAEQVVRAALAPAEPSPQDRTVAAEARQLAAQARIEIARQRLEEGSNQETGGNVSAPTSQRELGARFNSLGGSTLEARPDPLLDAVV